MAAGMERLAGELPVPQRVLMLDLAARVLQIKVDIEHRLPGGEGD
jgi:hypothetical protein